MDISEANNVGADVPVRPEQENNTLELDVDVGAELDHTEKQNNDTSELNDDTGIDLHIHPEQEDKREPKH